MQCFPICEKFKIVFTRRRNDLTSVLHRSVEVTTQSRHNEIIKTRCIGLVHSFA
jgi:hypothetical protein